MSDENDSWLAGIGVDVPSFFETAREEVNFSSDPSQGGVSEAPPSDDGGFTPGPSARSQDPNEGRSSQPEPADDAPPNEVDLSGGFSPNFEDGGASEGPANVDLDGGFSGGVEFGPPPPPEKNSSDAADATLDDKYRAAFARGNFEEAAEFLNGFSREDIQSRLSELGPEDVANLHQGALNNPRVGPDSNVAQMTRTGREPNFDDDPNTVFAGEHFRMKMLEGLSIGEIGGLTTFTFVIWDVDNNRAAVYEYAAVIVTFGTPITFTGEGDFSDVFTTKPMQVDQFSCNASHGAIGAANLGAMVLNLDVATVSVPTGFSKGGGIDAGGGFFSLAGPVKVFKG